MVTIRNTARGEPSSPPRCAGRFQASHKILVERTGRIHNVLMPVHDWTRTYAGAFHHLHVTWLVEISRALNQGLLPPGYYALGEQVIGGAVYMTSFEAVPKHLREEVSGGHE